MRGELFETVRGQLEETGLPSGYESYCDYMFEFAADNGIEVSQLRELLQKFYNLDYKAQSAVIHGC